MDIEISIIIPVFNKADFLEDCLDSVLGQSLKNLEVICIDDASEDNSTKILRDYASRDPRLNVINNRDNLGPAKSRNKGIEAASGKFLRFVDADDMIPQESTEILHSRALRDDVDLVKGSLALFRGNDSSVFQDVISVPDRTRTLLSSEKQLWVPWWHTSYLISTKLIQQNNIRYPDLIRGEDPVFLASVLVSASHLSMVDQIVYLYRKYPKVSGSGGSTMRHVVDTLKHATMTRDLFKLRHSACWDRGYGPFLLNDVRDFLGRCELDSSERQFVDSELERIWGNEALINMEQALSIENSRPRDADVKPH